MKAVSNSIPQTGLPPMARIVALGVFVGVVAMMGGSSRSDIASLPMLRGFATLALFAMLALVPAATWRRIRFPLILLGLLATWMIVQLAPLAPGMWSALPMRGGIFAIDTLLGTSDRWRPISMTPALTVNSLLALIVPAATLLVAAALPANERIRLWWAIWAFGVASAVFCLLQFVTGARSLFYLYRITNEGALVGLFANRNHNALLLSLSILAAGWIAANEISSRAKRPLLIPMLIGSMIFFLLLIVVIGSRFGLIFGSASLLLVYLLVRWSYRFEPKPINQARGRAQRRGPAHEKPARRLLINLIPFVLLGALAALFYFVGRGNAVDRLVNGDGVEEMRVAALGTVASLAETHWLLGSGFGSFAGVYQIVEPDALLRPEYFNRAHNDWLQLPIEGGLPAVLIFVAGIYWVVSGLLTLLRRGSRPIGVEVVELIVLVGAFGLIALNSLVDYPLRVQSFAMIGALLIVILAQMRAAARDSGQRG